MSLPIPPQTPSYSTGIQQGPLSPHYVDPFNKDSMQQMINAKIPQGAINNPGVALAKHGEDIPLEFAFGVRREFALATRPSLLPLFRTRYVDHNELTFPATTDYEELRNALSPELKAMLEADEKLPFQSRDPNVIALDNSLRFEALRRGILRSLMGITIDPAREQALAEYYQTGSDTAKKNLADHSRHVLMTLRKYLEWMGPNDPSYDLFMRAVGQMEEAIGLFE